MSAIDNLIDQLSSTKVEEGTQNTVNFVGRGLSLDTEADAAEIVQAIQNCPGMTTLCLEGNTFGIPAAKAIAKCLESQPNFKKALWKDMFTRRSKDEIPKALNYLSSGIMLAKAQLVVLDLSDNAFGPRGLIGLQELIQSSACYTLQELHLNNNGLGISGATMLSHAMCKCIENSHKHGTPMSLRIFVCGRNRLENEGAIAVSTFLTQFSTLESVAMPQNGIYPEGISQLANAFCSNPDLKVINLNDNSLREEGAECIADCLPSLKQLQLLNLGDCLVRTGGAIALAASLQLNCPELRELNLGYNEINKDGGLAIVDAMENKQLLQSLILNGNQFGTDGIQLLEDRMQEIEKYEMLGSLSEDEGNDDDEDDEYDDKDDEYDDVDDEETDSTDNEVEESVEEKRANQKAFQSPMMKSATPLDFLSHPTSDALISLYESNQDILSTLPENPTIDSYLNLFSKIASVVSPDDENTKVAAIKFTDSILEKAVGIASEVSEFNDVFLVHVGMIKGEDKKHKQKLEISGTLSILVHAVKQPYFPAATRDLLQFFLSRPLLYAYTSEKVKHLLMQTLYQI